MLSSRYEREAALFIGLLCVLCAAAGAFLTGAIVAVQRLRQPAPTVDDIHAALVRKARKVGLS